jgi:hypothetical protein
MHIYVCASAVYIYLCMRKRKSAFVRQIEISNYIMRSITWHDIFLMYIHYCVCKLMDERKHRNWKTQRSCNFHMELKTHKWVVPCTPIKLQCHSKTMQLSSQEIECGCVALPNFVCDNFCVQKAWKVHEATKFAYVQLNEHQ